MAWHVTILYGNDTKDAVIDAASPVEAIDKFCETLPDEILGKIEHVTCSRLRQFCLTPAPDEPALAVTH